MVHKSFLTLMVLFLCLSYVVSSAAVPITRILKSYQENPLSFQDLQSQDAIDANVVEELFNVGEGYIEGRIDLESTDYPGTGANNHHDPKTPGRA